MKNKMIKLILMFTMLIIVVSCGKKGSSAKTNGKYEVLGMEEINNSKIISILFKNDVSMQELKESMKYAAENNIGNSDDIMVYAFGDKRFYGAVGNTHGHLRINKDKKIDTEDYRPKTTMLDDKTIEIEVEKSKLTKELFKKNPDKQEENYKKVVEEMGKKYKITEKELQDNMVKVMEYIAQGSERNK